MDYKLISCDDHLDLAMAPGRFVDHDACPLCLRSRAPHIEERGRPRDLGMRRQSLGRMERARPSIRMVPRAARCRSSTRSLAVANSISSAAPSGRGQVSPLPTWIATGCRRRSCSARYTPSITDDPELRDACYRAYNDWLAEFCAAAPDRLIGVAMLPPAPERRAQGTSPARRATAAIARSICKSRPSRRASMIRRGSRSGPRSRRPA